jgi:hypothetical protein
MAAWNFYNGIATCLDCGHQHPGTDAVEHTCDATLYPPVFVVQGHAILAHESMYATDAAPHNPGCGAGTELTNLLDLPFHLSCVWPERARRMDIMGTAWCRKNIDMIVEWLREETEQHGLPLVEPAARRLIKSAIRRAEKPLNLF